MTRRRVGACTYCGQVAELDRDHVFPRSIFATPVQDMLTVRSCRPCQLRKQRGEDDLRDYIATHFRAAQHPNADGLKPKVERAIASHRSQLPAGAVRGDVDGVVIRQRSDAGLILPDIVASPFHFGAMTITMEMIVRGLYAHTFGTAASPDLPLEVNRIREADTPGVLQQVETGVPPDAWAQRGNGVVRWLCGLEQESRSVVFTIVFHRAIVWSAIMGAGALTMRAIREARRAEALRLGRLGLQLPNYSDDFGPVSPTMNVTLTALPFVPDRRRRGRPALPTCDGDALRR